MSEQTLELNQRQYLELEKIGLGAFRPLNGFMREAEFHAVTETMRLPDGQPFPLPVVLDLHPDQIERVRKATSIRLMFRGTQVGELIPESIFQCDKAKVAAKIFGSASEKHPGVDHFMRMGNWFVGGPVSLRQRVRFDFSAHELTPEETKAAFRAKGWKTVVGFQTRNVPHRAHEYLLRLALENHDAVFVQPLVGRKKKGDYTAEAILGGYRTLIDRFMPADRMVFGVLSTSMRYAGPREAVFHALVRRNYGCTHFIVGRDHAGVGSFYGKYEAQELTRQFEGELGISILRYAGPFYCSRCDGIVTERTCPHEKTEPESVKEVSGTWVRSIILKGEACPPHIMRPAVLESLAGTEVFISEDEA